MGCWATGIVLLALGWIAAPHARANESNESSCGDVRTVDGWLATAGRRAELDLWQRELTHLRGLERAGSSFQAFAAAGEHPDPVRDAVLGLLERSGQAVLNDLHAANDKVQSQIDHQAGLWRPIRDSVEAHRAAVAELHRRNEASDGAGFWLSVDCPWFWLAAASAIAAGIAVRLHAGRTARRRRAGGASARRRRRGLVAAAALVATILAAGAGVAWWYVHRASDSRKNAPIAADDATGPDGATANALANTIAPDVRQQANSLADALERRIAEAYKPDEALAKVWRTYRRQKIEFGRRAAILAALPTALRDDLAALAQLGEERAALDRCVREATRWKHGLRGAAGLMCLALVAAGGVSLSRRQLRQRQRRVDTCPLCFGSLDDAEPISTGDPASPAAVRCRNVLSEQPRVECHYAIRDAYREMTKLCFPTLGLPKAGKTHWLTMLYWQLHQGQYPKSVQFERLRRLQSDGSDEVDRMVEQVLRSRLGTTATQRDRIPTPVVLHFRDRDPWGRSDVLVNLFDYSGEVTSDMPVDDYRRRRALSGDGFLFFVDPTAPADRQAKALSEFFEDLRLVRGLPGGCLDVPVAVCVSKIDLLSQSPGARGDMELAGGFYAELARIDPTGESTRRTVFEARSRLVRRRRERIWPGWQIEQALEASLGPRWMFFPLTPVGLDGRGEADLSLRTIAPFGLLEPLLWLLDSQGYPVLD